MNTKGRKPTASVCLRVQRGAFSLPAALWREVAPRESVHVQQWFSYFSEHRHHGEIYENVHRVAPSSEFLLQSGTGRGPENQNF